MAKQIKCPRCKSFNVVPMGQQRKGFSLGKALLGSVMVTGVGALAGFAGKNGKHEWLCQDCHRVFKTK